MSDEQQTIHEPRVEAAEAREPALQEQPETDVWLDDSEPLPRRPRRRLLTPLPLALLAALAIACGFVAGVLVEKGQGAGATAAIAATGGGFASRLAASRSDGGSGGASGRSSAGGALGAGAAGASGTSASGGATAGEVAYVAGHTLYVTTAEGNTVKVTTSAAASVSKTVKASVGSIHPGETVLVTGATAANGSIAAESIRVGTGAAGGLGGARLGGAAAGGSASGSQGSGQAGSSAAGGAPALFGSGG